MPNTINDKIKAQEWIVMFDGRIKRSEKFIEPLARKENNTENKSSKA